MSNDVAIIGVGLHPFGRFDKPAVQMGAEAIRLALKDAGVEWKDIQFGFGGSYEVSNPDSVTRLVGLTGITFTNVFNACATSASAIQQTADTIRLGKYDIGVAVGLDKHPRGAFTDDPAKLALPQWYAENGQFVTTKFFGMKANKYIHDHNISQETLARVANKNFRNGAKNPNAFRRKEISVEEILNSPALNYPLTQYMFCAPDEGAAAVIMCRADIAHKFTDKPVFVKASEIRTRTFGAYEVHATSAPLDEDPSPTVYAAKAAYEIAGIGPEDVDIAQLQDTDAGAEVIHMAETGLCADGEQEKLLADGATEIHGSIPINTDGGSSPTVSRSVPRGCGRCTNWCASFVVRPATVRCPVRRASAWRRCTARPAPHPRPSSACSTRPARSFLFPRAPVLVRVHPVCRVQERPLVGLGPMILGHGRGQSGYDDKNHALLVVRQEPRRGRRVLRVGVPELVGWGVHPLHRGQSRRRW